MGRPPARPAGGGAGRHGEDYDELRGAELRGTVEILSEVPRTGTPDERLAGPERLFARKYAGGDIMHHDGRHAWLRLVPDTVTSWDFRKVNHSERTGAAPGDSASSPA